MTGLEKAMLQEVAARAQDDLVKRLTDAGFTVATYKDIQDDPEVVKLKRYTAKPEFPLPTDKIVNNNYLLVTPTDDQNIDPPIQGYNWPFRKVAKDKGYTLVTPVYTIDAPQMWGEKEEGYKRAAAGINFAPGMNVSMAIIWINNAKGGGAALTMKGMLRDVAEDVGSIESEDKSPNAANALSKGLSS